MKKTLAIAVLSFASQVHITSAASAPTFNIGTSGSNFSTTISLSTETLQDEVTHIYSAQYKLKLSCDSVRILMGNSYVSGTENSEIFIKVDDGDIHTIQSLSYYDSSFSQNASVTDSGLEKYIVDEMISGERAVIGHSFNGMKAVYRISLKGFNKAYSQLNCDLY